ncbi:unnamed protein product, partial [Rotaria sordida]
PTTNLVSDQLALMMEHFKKMTNAIDQISLEKTMVQLPSSSQSDDLEQMFQNITCSNDLYMLKYLEIVSWIPSHVYLILNLKKQALKHLLSTIKLSFGIFEKSEQYQPWKLLSLGSLILNRFRSEQVPRLPELNDD